MNDLFIPSCYHNHIIYKHVSFNNMNFSFKSYLNNLSHYIILVLGDKVSSIYPSTIHYIFNDFSVCLCFQNKL